MTVAYFDCFSGAAGDMIVGALIDAGADFDRLRGDLDALGLSGYRLSAERVSRRGISATHFLVSLEEGAAQPHRGLQDITAIVEGSDLSAGVKAKVLGVFGRLAEAEAHVHGTTVQKVHFHEVGAVDAILDICGAVLALEQLGVEQIACSPIPTGSGTVRCQHGVMPVPAPATAELLKGVPLAESQERLELTTPTGAAVLTGLAGSFGAGIPMRVSAVGYGAGTREGEFLPNVLRVMIGERVDGSHQDRVAVLETNIDDATPELIAHCLDRLLASGALDAYTQPIQMKKSRSGVMLSVICRPEDAGTLERLIFAETPTFGIRRHDASRVKLERRFETVDTIFGGIRIKVGMLEDIETACPEFEDCREAAQSHGVPLREVMAAAHAAWRGRA